MCGLFTEGFDTADYRSARAILDAPKPEIARQ